MQTAGHVTGGNDLLPDEYSAFDIGFSLLAACAYVFRWFYENRIEPRVQKSIEPRVQKSIEPRVQKSIEPRVTGSTVGSTAAMHYTSLTVTRRLNAVLT
jgi:hypothetical protein